MRPVENQDLSPTSRTKGGGSIASGGSVAGSDDDEVMKVVCQPLSLPGTEYVRGVILISAVLPPFQDFVVSHQYRYAFVLFLAIGSKLLMHITFCCRLCRKGRVGTGLAFRRTSEGSWSDPKPCSFTALVSPIPDRSQKTALDMIFFVCGGRDYREDDDWWHSVSDPTGLLLEEHKSQSSKTTNGHLEESQEDDADTLETGVRLNRPSASGKGRISRSVNLANLEDSTMYPFAYQHEVPDETFVPTSLYYYCWNKDHLLTGSTVSLERVMIIEFHATQRKNESDEDPCRLESLLKHLFQQFDDKSIPEVIQPEILVSDTNGTMHDEVEENISLTEGPDTANGVLLTETSTLNAGTGDGHDATVEGLVSPAYPENANDEFKATHNEDVIEGKRNFVSDEFC